MEVLAMVENLPLPILRGAQMIPDSIPFVLLFLTIFAAPIYYGRTTTKEDSK